MTCILHLNYLMMCDSYFFGAGPSSSSDKSKEKGSPAKALDRSGQVGSSLKTVAKRKKGKARIVEHQVKRKGGWMQLNLENYKKLNLAAVYPCTFLYNLLKPYQVLVLLALLDLVQHLMFRMAFRQVSFYARVIFQINVTQTEHKIPI